MLYNNKYYRDLETLPIFAWDKVQQTNDVSWLLHKPRKNVNKYLLNNLTFVYVNLLKSYKSPDNRILTAKRNVIRTIIDLVSDIAINSKDAQKIERASVILRALMIDSSSDVLLWKGDFVETAEQRQMLTLITIAVKKYTKAINITKGAKKQTIYDQLASLETNLGISIDIHKCPVVQWQSYVKASNTKNNG